MLNLLNINMLTLSLQACEHADVSILLKALLYSLTEPIAMWLWTFSLVVVNTTTDVSESATLEYCCHVNIA